MWIAKTKHFESEKLFIPSKVMIFKEKPVLASNGCWYVLGKLDCVADASEITEYGVEIPEYMEMAICSNILKEGECKEFLTKIAKL